MNFKEASSGCIKFHHQPPIFYNIDTNGNVRVHGGMTFTPKDFKRFIRVFTREELAIARLGGNKK